MINSVKSILEKLGYEVNAEDRLLAEFFNENGYCVIPKSDFLSENIDEYRRIIDSLLQKESWRGGWEGKEEYMKYKKDFQPGANRLANLFNKNDLFQHTGNIFVCRYDYSVLRVLAQTQRHLLTQLHKERGNGKENALSAIKFFDNPDVKNIITQMIVKHSAIKNKIEKTIKLAQETEETVDDVSLNYDELFNQMKNIGIDYFSQKKAEEDEK